MTLRQTARCINNVSWKVEQVSLLWGHGYLCRLLRWVLLLSPYCRSGCQCLLVHSDVSWLPSSSGLFLHIRVSHFDKQHYSLYLPTCLPHPNKLIQDLHLHCYFLDPSLSYKAQWLIGNTNSHWIPKSWYLIPIVLLLTLTIFLLIPEFPDTFWLPNFCKYITQFNKTCPITQKTHYGEREQLELGRLR